MARTTIRSEDITATEVAAGDLAGTLDLSSKTVTLPAASVTAHVTATDTTGIEDDIALLGFKVAANGSLARYDLVDQSIDVFEDASGVDASASTDEIRNAANYYSGQGAPPTGGTEVIHSTYTSHTFLADGNFVVAAGGGGDLDYFIIAGGGAGGGYALAGGGGAGHSGEYSWDYGPSIKYLKHFCSPFRKWVSKRGRRTQKEFVETFLKQ